MTKRKIRVPELCPMGCGRTTEDPYGGPCQRCWDAVENDPQVTTP